MTSDKEDVTHISEIAFSHVGCSEQHAKLNRNQVTGNFDLTCPCGLELYLDPEGRAAHQIHVAFHTSSVYSVPAELFFSEQTQDVSFVPGGVA